MGVISGSALFQDIFRRISFYFNVYNHISPILD